MSKPMVQKRGVVARAGLLAALAGLAANWGCSGPLSAWDSDRGVPLAPERTRRLERLSLDQFKAAGKNPASPTPAMDESQPKATPARLSAATMDLSIDQARADVLANNLDLKVALIAPSMATETRRAEEAKFEAVFRAFLRYRNLDQPTVDVTSPIQEQGIEAGAGVDIPLRTGGRLSVDYTTDKTDAANSFLLAPTTYGSALTFSISQPLLRGAGRDVATASIKVAAYDEQIAESRMKLQVIAQLAAADRAYWLLYAARRELEVRQQQFDVAREQLGKAERRVRAGESAEIEVTRAQSGMAERLEGIIRAENAVLLAQRDLKRLINRQDMDLAGGTTVVTITQPSPVEFAFDGAALCELAAANRMELLEAELALLADAVNIDVARNATLPALNLDGSYSFSGLGTTFSGNNKNLASASFQSFTAGASGEIPIGNEAAEARLRRAVLARIQRLAGRDSRLQTVRQEVLNAVDQVGASWQRILAARQAAILAGRTLQGEQRQFDAGVRTSTDVLDAAARLVDAQSSEIRALTDYQIALVDLAVATGTTLGAARVDFEPLGSVLLRDERERAEAARREEARKNPPALGPQP